MAKLNRHSFTQGKDSGQDFSRAPPHALGLCSSNVVLPFSSCHQDTWQMVQRKPGKLPISLHKWLPGDQWQPRAGVLKGTWLMLWGGLGTLLTVHCAFSNLHCMSVKEKHGSNVPRHPISTIQALRHYINLCCSSSACDVEIGCQGSCRGEDWLSLVVHAPARFGPVPSG